MKKYIVKTLIRHGGYEFISTDVISAENEDDAVKQGITGCSRGGDLDWDSETKGVIESGWEFYYEPFVVQVIDQSTELDDVLNML
jgi:hypothetical protein